ncbi:helix-turn-helix domain-containing protein [Nocardia sp. NPDC050175]|uniref:helix-turn-helix domain-containing protein n=1 Tax=Nocardia sp. NPDC050175 TaxID=3364317 RepID=UPI0037B8E39B
MALPRARATTRGFHWCRTPWRAGYRFSARRALGERLRELRRDAGLSGVALASAADWQGSKVSKIEHGRQTPTEADIHKWCRWCRADYAEPDQAPATNFVIHDRKVVLVETVAAELTITRPSEIALYEKSFALLAAQAVHGAAARALIGAALTIRTESGDAGAPG